MFMVNMSSVKRIFTHDTLSVTSIVTIAINLMITKCKAMWPEHSVYLHHKPSSGHYYYYLYTEVTEAWQVTYAKMQFSLNMCLFYNQV